MRLAERCGVSWRALEETGASRHRTRRGRNVGGRGNRRAVRAGANGVPRLPVNAVEEDRWDERLSCLSSCLPWFSVPEDCVEDGEKLPHDGDQGELFRLPASTRRW